MTTENTSLEAMLDAEESVETSAPAPAETAPPETGDKPSAAPPADANAQAEPSDDAPHVPRKAYVDERKKRQELERRLRELEQSVQSQQRHPQSQQPQPPVITQEDLERLWWENPAQAAAIVQNIAVQNATAHAERMMLSRELDRSERRVRKTHGDDKVSAALQQARNAGMIDAFLNEDDPYQTMMDWYSEVEVVRDPKSAREKIEAEVLAKYGITPSASKPVAQAAVPKSLASRTSAQPRASNGQFQERASLDELLG